MDARMKTRLAALALAGLSVVAAPVIALGNLHPYFALKHLLPPELDNIGGIGGIGLLPNGDGVICTWGGSQQPTGTASKSNGEVWIIPKLATGEPGTAVRVATGLREPLGVSVVGADFYVMEKPRIAKFTGSGTTWTKSTLWSLPTAWYNDDQWHHFSFNLIYKDGAFWFTTGTAYDYNPKDPLQRGALIKVPQAGGDFTQMARGLRNPNGLGVGPEGEFFVPENQGHWKPADALYHLPVKGVPANGRFFGFRTEGNNACGITPPNVANTNCAANPEYPPAIWIPYGGFSNSPTRPILLKDGPYAGQMIGGDVFHGGTFRYFLEKVNGEWQGAVFAMMTPGAAGINYGIHQFHYTPSGALLVTGIGGGTCGLGGSGNWNYNGTCRGLDLLTPTGTAAFEILAIRSENGGFDVEFTQPASAAAGVAANWQVKTTVFTPVQAYGQDSSSNDNNITVAVASATLSADGKHARLQLAGTATHRMYAITASNVVSATGAQPLYTNVGYYTLNNTGPAVATGAVADFARRARASAHSGRVTLEVPWQGAWRLELVRPDGVRVASAQGRGPGSFTSGVLPRGVYLLAGSEAGAGIRELIRVQ